MKTKRDFHKQLISHIILVIAAVSLVSSCSASPAQPGNPAADTSLVQAVPQLDHVVMITFENREYYKIIGNPFMPTYNKYAQDYTLLTQFYAVTHPSLPNYIAMISGDTFDITKNCEDCFVDAPSLPDLIEASGRTWKTYQEDMQTPCALGSQDEDEYVQKHNPFVYFDSIRLNQVRCQKSVVPFDELHADMEAGTLPNFIFITPNMCNNAHDCRLYVSDAWVKTLLDDLIPAFEKESQNYLIVLNWDEGDDDGSCCGLPEKGGGRIAVVLISPLIKNSYEDPTPYSHYSLLKTISASWDLPYLGHAADEESSLILAPWK